MLTLSELSAIMPYAGARAEIYLEPLNATMDAYHIDTPTRQAPFLANVAVESGSLKYVEELADGAAYEGRADLGNTQPGDGRKFKGRGLLQVTGRANYASCSLSLFSDLRLIDQPELLEEPDNAARSAGWFWYSRGLNVLADQLQFRTIVRKINGGLNGLDGPDGRLAYWAKAKEVLFA